MDLTIKFLFVTSSKIVILKFKSSQVKLPSVKTYDVHTDWHATNTTGNIMLDHAYNIKQDNNIIDIVWNTHKT